MLLKRACGIAVFGGATGDETRESMLNWTPSGGDSSRSSREESLLVRGVALD